MNTNPTARRIATIEGWLNQPTGTRGQPSEGHTSAVTVLRMVNSHQQHQAAEPVPFRQQRAPLRSIKPSPPTSGCAGNGSPCVEHPDCAHTTCENHPDNQGPDLKDDEAMDAFFRRLIVSVVVFVLAVLALQAWKF